jgi:hypothetical protein
VEGKLDYDRWCESIREGRNYVGDGRSHLFDFKVNDVAMGESGSELNLAQPGNVSITAKVAALLDEKAKPEIQKRPYDEKPYWDIERARVDATREVRVEAIVNGFPVAKKAIVADGSMQDVAFDVSVTQSSWIALRILPTSHSNPIFVLVDGKPIRASKRSADWCLKGVDRCWSQKERFIRASEVQDAKMAYAHARETYRKLVGECQTD